jgi:protein gp37
MGIRTGIAWCDSTVNPVVGCKDGCELYHKGMAQPHCYAQSLVSRYAGQPGWPKSFDEPEYFAGRIEWACAHSDLTGTRRPDKPHLDGFPRLIFVNDLSDGFGSGVPPEIWLLPNVQMMEKAPHIWLLLTKHPWKMERFFRDLGRVPDNFWLGTTITSTLTAWRAEALSCITKAPLLFISFEPLLGYLPVRGLSLLRGIGWAIVGGESGVHARPCDPGAVRHLRNACQADNVPFFFKAWGEWLPDDQKPTHENCARQTIKYCETGDQLALRVGRQCAGRLLDGQEWLQMPRWPLDESEEKRG